MERLILRTPGVMCQWKVSAMTSEPDDDENPEIGAPKFKSGYALIKDSNSHSDS